MKNYLCLDSDFCLNKKARGGGKHRENKKEAKYNKRKSYSSKHVRIQTTKKSK